MGVSPHAAEATTRDLADRPGLTYTATSATSGDIRDATGRRVGGWREMDLKKKGPSLEQRHQDHHATENVEGGIWRWGKYVQNGAYHCYSNFTHPAAVHQATALLGGDGVHTGDVSDRKVANPGYAADAHVSLPDEQSETCRTYYWVY